MNASEFERYVNEPTALESVIRRIDATERVAVDNEADGLENC